MLTVTGHIIEMEHGALFKSEKIRISQMSEIPSKAQVQDITSRTNHASALQNFLFQRYPFHFMLT